MILTVVMGSVWVIGTLGGLGIFSTSVWRLLGSRRLPGGFRLRAIALELVRDEGQLRNLLKECCYPPDKAEKDLKLDDRILIPAYAILFVALTVSLLRSGALPNSLGAAVLLCVTGAALSDYWENHRARAVLRARDQTTLDRLRPVAYAKWALLFVLMALLAVAFARQGGWFVIVAAIYLATAGVGSLGLLGRRPPLVEWAFALMRLALAVTGAALLLAIARQAPT